jgi:hypothetical protein
MSYEINRRDLIRIGAARHGCSGGVRRRAMRPGFFTPAEFALLDE